MGTSGSRVAAIATAVLMVTAGLGSLGALAHPASEATTDDTCAIAINAHGCYNDLSSALDALEKHPEYDVVIAAASENGPENPTPFNEKIEITQSGITVCSQTSDFAEAEEPQSTPPVVIAKDETLCDPQPLSTVIQPDESVVDESAVEIAADGVTFEGFSVRYEGDVSDGFTGIKISGDDATINETRVRVPGGCAPQESAQSGCAGSPTVDGINVNGNGATIRSTTVISQQVNPEDPTRGFASRGIYASSGTMGAIVEDVSVQGFTVGVFTRADQTVLRDSALEGNFRGVQVAGENFAARDNGFQGSDAAVYFSGDAENPVLRNNDFDLTNRVALLFSADLDSITVDAPGNFWGVVTRDVIPQRFSQDQIHDVDYMPYRDAADNLHPPAPAVSGTPSDGSDCEAEGEVLTLQDAVDAAAPGCTVQLYDDEAAYDEATINKPLTLSAAPVGANELGMASFNNPRDAHVLADGDEPALAFEPGSGDSTVSHVRIEAEGQATGVQTNDVDEAVTLENLVVTGSGTGVHAIGGQAPVVTSPPSDSRQTTLAGLDTPIAFENADDGAIRDTRIVQSEFAGEPTIRLSNADRTTIERVTLDANDDRSTTAIALTESDEVRVADSTITRAATGIDVEGSDDVEIEDNGIHVASRAIDLAHRANAEVTENTLTGVGPAEQITPSLPSAAVFLGPGTTDWNVEDNTIEAWGFAGVYVTSGADASTIVDNEIRETWQFAIYAANPNGELVIRDNAIERAGLTGINLEQTEHVLVEDNEISLDVLPGADARELLYPENEIVREPGEVPAAGLWVQGAQDVTIRENTFSGDAKDGVLITNAPGAAGQQPDVNPIRHNEFVLADATEDVDDDPAAVKVPNVQALRIGSDVTTVGGEDPTTLDARLNDWGVYEWQLVEQRANDESGEIRIDQLPYLMPNGPHGLPISSLP
jgi:nitrous oxidase accessory protein NosD